uniref:Uncharacterized protein n=1 Tax=Cyclopterus lumpus TaxID=8103 RepID=A0A8C3A475_CYCLU
KECCRCNSNTLFFFDTQINELGNPKAKKPDDIPLFYEVTEPAKVLLDAGEEIPCDLMAKILKFQLLRIKANDQQRREAEQLEMGSCIFEGVAKLIYDCLDWRRQHQHYLHSIQLLSVPTVVVATPHPLTPRSKKKSTQRPPLSTEVDMRYYCNLLDLVPPEVCSVPLILHCMLEQVVISTEESLPTVSCVAEAEPHNGLGLDSQLISFMLQSFLPLVHTKVERSHMLNSLLTTAQNEEDKKAVQGFDPAEVELSMMRRSPVWELIQSVARPRDSNSCWMAIKQQLQHYCTDDVVSWLVVERLIHQSVFESMPLTRLGPNGVLQNAPGPLGPLYPAHQQTPTIIPWDNPLSYAKQQRNILHTKGLLFLINSITLINFLFNCRDDISHRRPE